MQDDDNAQGRTRGIENMQMEIAVRTERCWNICTSGIIIIIIITFISHKMQIQY